MKNLYFLSSFLFIIFAYCEAFSSNLVEGNTFQNDQKTIKCVNCAGTECDDSVNPPQLKNCTSCAVALVDNTIKKGCESDFKSNEIILTCNQENCTQTAEKFCYKCSSKDDKSCLTVNDNTKTGKCPDLKTQCVTIIDNEGYTVRGCETDNLKCKSDDTECISCLQKNCNTMNVHKDHLKCYQCNDNSCIHNVTSDQLQFCSKYKKKDSCYIYALNENSVTRGCSSNLDPNSNKPLFNCNGNGCNSQNAVEEIKCVQCTSKQDGEECFRKNNAQITEKCRVPESLKTCTIKRLLNHSDGDRCYTNYQNGAVQRGCTNDTTNVAYKYCNNESLCNNKCTHLQCYVCDSNSDPKCKSKPDEVEIFECDQNMCYNCSDNAGTIYRGCGKQKDGNMNCSTCTSSDKCNNYVEPTKNLTCYSCDSRVDANCAQLTNITKLHTIECSDKNSKCGTTIQDGKYTVRGCAPGNFTCNPNDKNCTVCEKKLCNDGIFPENRRKCYTCKNSDDCDKEQKPDNGLLQICRNYNANDSCYAYAVSHTDGKNTRIRMNRGCQSDNDDYTLCKKEGDVKCKVCGTGECNSFPLQSKPKLSCIKCEKNNTACGWGYDVSKKSSCFQTYFYYSEESCYVRKFNNSEVQRGCSLDDGICPNGTANCTLCSKDGCNNENVITQSCIQCDSSIPDQSKKCTSGKDITATVCQGIISYENRGCYTKHDGAKTIRGCAAQLEGELQKCKDGKNKKLCEFCEKDGCNSNSGNIISTTLTTTILLSIFTISVFK